MAGGVVVAALSPAEPTGNQVIDAALVAASTAAVIYAAASAPWWALTVGAMVSVVVAGDASLLVGVAGGVLALYIGYRKRNLSELRALSAAVTCGVLARADIDARFGLTAAVALIVGALLLITGLRRRPRLIRRRAWMVGGAVGGFAVLATAGFLVEAAAARSALADGKREAQLAVDAIERGEYDVATDHFQLAEELLSNARDHFRRPWAFPAAAVPIVAQHRSAVADLSSDGATAVEAAATAVAEVDPEALRVEGGVIDLDAVEALAAPIRSLNVALDGLSVTTDNADSRWLVSAVRDELDELSVQLGDNAERLDDVTTAVELAPRMLGRDGARRYLILFSTPAEARGLGGFIGNYAELTIDGGRLEMTDFGRVSDLEAQGRELGVRITGPDEFLRRYGTFGYNTDGNGLVGAAPWRNLSVSPDFPAVAAVAAEMYPQVTGTAVDGVIVVDPYVVGTLLTYTGPITLSTVDFTIDASNAANYILLGQYQTDDQLGRIDALEEVARRTVEALLSGAMPGPDTLARDLGPYAADGRLAVWTSDPAEQDLLRRVDLLGEIPALNGADGWSVTVTNAGGSKIDTFLGREFTYESATTDGVTTATLRVTLDNTAPNSGLPDYVIGNVIGMPLGNSRLYVSFYSALDLSGATLDGEPIELASSMEAGWHVYSGYVTLASGEAATYELTLTGTVSNPRDIVTWVQPLVIPPVITPST